MPALLSANDDEDDSLTSPLPITPYSRNKLNLPWKLGYSDCQGIGMETRQLEFYRNSFAEEDRGGKGQDIYILRYLQRGRGGRKRSSSYWNDNAIHRVSKVQNEIVKR